MIRDVGISPQATEALQALLAPASNSPAISADDLAQEIRRVGGKHSLGAAALAEALLPLLASRTASTSASTGTGHQLAGVAQDDAKILRDVHAFIEVLLPTEGREAHGRPGRTVVLEATSWGRPWPTGIVLRNWVAGRDIGWRTGGTSDAQFVAG